MEILSTLLNIAVLVYAGSSMLSVGIGYALRQIIGPLRNTRAVIRALVGNFVLVPLLALVVLQIFHLDRSLAVGLFLVASGAGAPFLIKLAQAAETDVALSATLLVVLLPATILYLPIVMPMALPEAHVSAGVIARPLLLTMLLPLGVGLLVRAYAARWALRLQPLLGPLSTAALAVLITVTILMNLQEILRIFRTDAILAAFFLIGGAFAIGYFLGGHNRAARQVFGLGTGQRNIAAATVVAIEAIGDPDTLSMVVVSSLVGFALLFPIAAAMRRRRAREAFSH